MASRAIGIFVATLSFGVAALGAVRYFGRGADTTLENLEIVIGLVLAVTVLAGIMLIERVSCADEYQDSPRKTGTG
jgi:hypothetical protein